ncbi:hypothetical protein ASE90_04190 [Sphingomonas sp. Leaf67]|uniref:hypothetical protein n=1 Tax=Sphingomonas sp. Leaf67 TaxID=1736230 RepID=UPI000701FD7C|nr:hypothetical protein [Sphingomonas sp. Leaf67]KQN91962.1 hypothetical protein ASE90_04190 [Sphingomonas sp. Leaf67]
MRRYRTLIAGALLLTGAAPAEPARYPPRSILLFVASWCAPCHGELRQLPAIAAGAGAYRVLVVPIDRGRVTDAMLRVVPAEQLWRPDMERLAELRGDLLAKTAGLPFSVAIGGDGRACAMHRGGMTAASAREMRVECEG